MIKKVLCLFIAVFMVIGLCACGSDNGGAGGNAATSPASQQENNGNTGTTAGAKPENTESNTGSGAIVGVKSDIYAPAAGSQADKFWHVKEIQNVYEFSSDGKCTVKDTVYYLKNASDYDEASAQLEGGNWNAVWSDDKTYFTIEQGFKDYTSVEDAIEDIENDFLGYTITYSNGGSNHIDPPTDERKTELMKEVFGFTLDELDTTYGNYTFATRKMEKVMVTYISGATVDDMNALAKAAFSVCSAVADDGKMYDYLGKYGSELTAAPETDSIFNSAQFNYFKNGKEISVEAEILNSEGYDNTLALLVYIVK